VAYTKWTMDEILDEKEISAVKEFIIDKVCEGYTPKKIWEMYPDTVPHYKSIYRHQLHNEEFRKEMDDAYAIFLNVTLTDYASDASKLASEVYPDVDWRQAEAAMKRMQKARETILGQIAYTLSSRHHKKQEIEIKGEVTHNNPVFSVIHYHTNQVNNDKNTTIDVTPTDKKLLIDKDTSNTIPNMTNTGQEMVINKHIDMDSD
jgi:hypothetical protein